MDPKRYLEERPDEARRHLAEQPVGTVAHRDALAAVRYFERVILSGSDLLPTGELGGLAEHQREDRRTRSPRRRRSF